MLDGAKGISVEEALVLAQDYYDEKTLTHAMRVAGYVAKDKSIPVECRQDAIALAIMHDLVEDTEYEYEGLDYGFKTALQLLTKEKDYSYVDYCKNIKESVFEFGDVGCLARWVKIADIKDHLNLKDTLTEKRKTKYLEGLAELL